MKCLKVFSDFVETTEELSDAELGRLFRAMMHYAFRSEESTISGNERFLNLFSIHADKYSVFPA